MKTVPVLMTLASVASLGSLAGCAHQWETVLDGRLYSRTHLHRYPVSIVAVDGEYSTFVPRRIDAGLHELLIDAAPTKASYLPDRNALPSRRKSVCATGWPRSAPATILGPMNWSLTTQSRCPVVARPVVRLRRR